MQNGRAQIEVQKASVNNCMEELKTQLTHFLNHVYFKRQQSQVFKCALENVGLNDAIIQIDFSENYTCKEQRDSGCPLEQ